MSLNLKMMTKEDDDLEEELRCLDIREDLGADDSDVTPTNTPPTSPPILYIKKYPPNNTNYEDFQDCGRYSRQEESDSRTESSLSWGDDEFEGEATRQVGMLFDQLDSLLYNEQLPLSPVPYSSEFSNADNLSIRRLSDSHVKTINDAEDSPSKEDSEESIGISDVSRTTTVSQRENAFDVAQVAPTEILYNSSSLLKSSPRFNIVATLEPTAELQEECSSWVQHFPHFRVRGRSLSNELLSLLEECMAGGSASRENVEEKEEEEVITDDGDFHHLLPLVSFNSANQVKNSRSDDQRRETSSSRVCSGSNDPEVLKEQILILLFDKLWSSMTKTLEPLLHQYAKYIIEQSVQYSSLSREPSTRGARCQTPSRKVSEEVKRTDAVFPKPSYAVQRLITSESKGSCETNRPLSGIRRSCSAANRLQSPHFAPYKHQEELQDLLQISSKPLQMYDDRGRFRTSSASAVRGCSAQSISQVSLPSLSTPRTPVHRPVSSKIYNHLTPLRVEGPISYGEQRPASTSSYYARTRFQEKFQHMSRHGTIQESWGDNSGLDVEKDDSSEVANSAWSRHMPFLPPITDSGETPHKQHQQPHPPVMTGEDLQRSALSVRGTMLSASHRPPLYAKSRNHVFGPVMTEAGRSKELTHADEK
ncbi:uncharacterized protein [Procambarus clarkii]|uniref:uncharacterized protein isoform X2 n=1 Tax=Procambarus clarkii TaxID=6728 RepID=UPI0037441BB9